MVYFCDILRVSLLLNDIIDSSIKHKDQFNLLKFI